MNTRKIDPHRLKPLYDANVSLAEIGRTFGVTRQAVGRYCVRHGLGPRRSTCRHCGKPVRSQRGRVYCSKKCQRCATQYDKCSCGNVKARTAERCRECRETSRGTIKKAISAYCRGMTYRQVGALLGYGTMTICDWVKAAGIKARPRGTRPKKRSA